MLQRTRFALLACHVLLVAGILAWSPNSLGIAAALVLLTPLPGLWQRRLRTHAWASMLIAFYCAFLLADGYARPGGRVAPFALAALAALEFVALNLYVRGAAALAARATLNTQVRAGRQQDRG